MQDERTRSVLTPGLRRSRQGGRAGVASIIAVLVAGMLITVAPVAVQAVEPNQVSGLTAEQGDGFATLRWTALEGAGEYEIERTPVNDANEPTGPAASVGIWRPNRQVPGFQPTFADAGFNPGDRFQWRVRARFGLGLPNQVVVDAPSSAAGTYEAAGATYGPAPSATGISGNIILVNDGTASPTLGCSPLIGFPAGAVALIDRGACNFVVKTENAQAAGASAVIIANNTGGTPNTLTGTLPGATIPSVHIPQADGATLKAGLPATGTVRAAPTVPFSEPVFGTTLAQWGDPTIPGQNMRTQWEQTQAAQFTNDVNEYEYTAALDAASERVRVVEIARTQQDRPVNLFIIGYPAAPPTAEAVVAKGSIVVNCNVHGNEPSSREACLILARELAFGNDARTIDILSNTTILLVPSINADGRAANSRGNSTGQDLNRDHSLLRQPETFGFAKMLHDYQPRAGFDGHEFGNSNAGDLPVLPPRHQNVAQEIFDQSQDMIINGMYQNGSEDGWWYCPYGCQGGGNVGLSEETILRNTSGLKNSVASLLEARSSGGATRPNEGNTQNNRRRKTYSAVYTYQQFFDYDRANQAEIKEAVADAKAFQISNTGRIVFRGTRPIPAFPAPHPGEAPPPQDTPTGNDILEDPPCGYIMTYAQYETVLNDDPDVAVALRTSPKQRFAAHGWNVQERPAGVMVRMAQEQRGLIPLLVDDQAAEEMLDAQRLYECPYVQATEGDFDQEIVEGNSATTTLTIANIATEPNQPLNWTIVEATGSCSNPTDLPWLSTSSTSGSTASGGGTTNLSVTFDAGALTAPDAFSGLLCILSNDSGEPVIAFPVDLQVLYPFGGFQAPIGDGLNVVTAGSNVPVKFQVGGERTSDVLAAGYPVSVQVDCATLEPIGSPTATNSGSGLVWDGDKYQYDWKTQKNWKNTCRALIVVLDDTSEHVAYFRFVN